MRFRFALAASLLLLLTGCVSAPPLNFSVQGVEPSKRKVDAELRSVSVSYAAPSEQTGDVPSDGEGVPFLWERALSEAINKSSIFDDESAKKVNLFVKIRELDPPEAGITMTTGASAKYLLVDRKTGATILEENITTKGVVPPGYAFAGYVRAKESINRAVQTNIQEFLSRLETSAH
ncbi:UDP-N-acetylglucosamine acyltransferase [Pseudomonas monteilii]|uniref:UDP-N-acetylglucosamine acyltransferase n=1 Tax=Pseudomonas monteilii TaxID=76759 RepID=UPI0018D8CD96|nr:UDP-N-acetylglucosamine acyltransferase [Pseudomonas monteilii]MBH3395822.1 UDP-N-acetylglucosamine acyltransferase [Pseudomonas monteilii]